MSNEREAEEMLSDLISEILRDVRLRRSTSRLCEERQSKETEKDLKDFGVRILCSRNANISDVLTGVRIACGVAVVTQKMPAIRTKGGDTILNVKVRYLPQPGAIPQQFADLAKRIQAVHGVNTISFKDYEGAPIIQQTARDDDAE